MNSSIRKDQRQEHQATQALANNFPKNPASSESWRNLEPTGAKWRQVEPKVGIWKMTDFGAGKSRMPKQGFTKPHFKVRNVFMIFGAK